MFLDLKLEYARVFHEVSLEIYLYHADFRSCLRHFDGHYEEILNLTIISFYSKIKYIWDHLNFTESNKSNNIKTMTNLFLLHYCNAIYNHKNWKYAQLIYVWFWDTFGLASLRLWTLFLWDHVCKLLLKLSNKVISNKAK